VRRRPGRRQRSRSGRGSCPFGRAGPRRGRISRGSGREGARRRPAARRRARVGVVPAPSAARPRSQGARQPRRRPMKLIVNGVEYDLQSPPLVSLLTALREELDITSPKAGCHKGGCGACTVLVDGEARRSCLLPLAAVDGAAITTLEGLGTSDNLSSVQAAFDEHYTAQCGLCTSGFIMAATALIDRT